MNEFLRPSAKMCKEYVEKNDIELYNLMEALKAKIKTYNNFDFKDYNQFDLRLYTQYIINETSNIKTILTKKSKELAIQLIESQTGFKNI